MKNLYVILLLLSSLGHSQIIINEINYNSSDDFNPDDWIELYNPTENSVDLSNWTVIDENQDNDNTPFVIPQNTTLDANGYLVITKDSSLFTTLFPNVTNFIGDIGFGLSGSGDQIKLFNSNNVLIDFVEYDDKAPWPICADGNGASLELILYDSDNTLPESWQCGLIHGSPGSENGSGDLNTNNIVINEINYNSSDNFNPDDWIELYNPNSTSVDLSNWTIIDRNEDNDNIPFIIPQNTTLEANSYLVIAKDSNLFSSVFPNITNFIGDIGYGLSGGGDQIKLFDANEILIDFVEYDDESPWPLCADGNGPTLELIDYNSDNTLPESWQCGLTHGSPGALNGSGLSNPKNNIANIEIFPNPVNHKLELNGELNGDFLITIYDVSAKRILSIKNSKLIDISHLNKGFYFLNLSSNNQLIKTLKFIKQ